MITAKTNKKNGTIKTKSPAKRITTSKTKKGNTIVTETVTTFYTPSYGGKQTSIKKTVKTEKASSPTRRIIDMKNSSLKHKQNAANVCGSESKMLYTLDPKNAYLVENEFPSGVPSDEVIKKLDTQFGFAEDFTDESGKVIRKYYYASPFAQRVTKGGKLEEVKTTFEVDPSHRIVVTEKDTAGNVNEIITYDNIESRRDFIKRMEDKTRDLNDQVQREFDESRPTYATRSSNYHYVLRNSFA